ncbi:MAG: hypothetical protein ACTSUP_01685 [Candidatus Heimdallarchaeaceae archaeon]
MQEGILKTKNVLEESGINFWVDCGALLKLYRDDKIDETDFDFSIKEKDSWLLLKTIPIFLSQGFKLRAVYSHPKKGLTEITIVYNNYPIDIFVKFVKDKWSYHISTNNDEFIIAKFPNHHFQKLETKYFIGTVWNIPSDTENYLKRYYGDEWKTPKNEWDWTKDASCIDNEIL